MMPFRDSKTAPTCFRDSSVSLEMVAVISDLVGAPPFFAMFWILPRFDVSTARNIRTAVFPRET
jgi:hypothetical protein